MEADLQRFYQVDYRDRWRDRLPLRRLAVLVRHLPPTSAVGWIQRGEKPHWTIEAHLLDELRMTLVHSEKDPAKPHPERPHTKKTRKDTPQRRAKLADARRRARERREQRDRDQQEGRDR